MNKLKYKFDYLILFILWILYTFIIRNRGELLLLFKEDLVYLVIISIVIPLIGYLLNRILPIQYRKVLLVTMILCSLWSMLRGYLRVDYYNEFYFYLLLIPIFGAALSIDTEITEKSSLKLFTRLLGISALIEIGFMAVSLTIFILTMVFQYLMFLY